MAGISEDEAKRQLNLEGVSLTAEQTNELTTMRSSVSATFEKLTRRALIEGVFRLFLSCFTREIALPVKPYKEGGTISINYYDVDDAERVLGASNYKVEYMGPEEKTRIFIHGDLPALSARRRHGVFIDFQAGYGEDETDVPSDVKMALLMMLHNEYLNRGGHTLGVAFGPDSYKANQKIAEGLMAPFVVHGGIE